MFHTQNYSSARWLQNIIDYIKSVSFSIPYVRATIGSHILSVLMSKIIAIIAPRAQKRGKREVLNGSTFY